MDANFVLLSALTQPEYSRREYFVIQQGKSGYSPDVFFKLMLDAHRHYVAKIKTTFSKPDVSGLPLLSETNWRLNGHLFLSDLQALKKNIEEARELLNEKTVKSQNSKPDPNLELITFFNYASEFQNIKAILAKEELIDINTCIAKTGKGTKGVRAILAGVIKDLFPKGYLTRRLTHQEIKIILLNTFRLKVGIDTINHCETGVIKIPYSTQNTIL